jgi:hypothetical protein
MEWKPVAGYEGFYEVSSSGLVKSLSRTITCKTGRSLPVSEKLLRPGKGSHGYHGVMLCKNGEGKIHTVHRLVAEAFLENPLGLSDVNHKDENKLNNSVENLEWCTRKYNIRYSRSPVLHKGGPLNPNARLSAESVVAIRELAIRGVFPSDISKIFDVSNTAIRAIINGRSHTNVKVVLQKRGALESAPLQ